MPEISDKRIPDHAPEKLIQSNFEKIKNLLGDMYQGSYEKFVLGTQTPNEDHRPWIRLDESGKIIGIYTFMKGTWVRFNEFPLSETVKKTIRK